MTGAPGVHPRDITEAELKVAISATGRPDILKELVSTSRGNFGFFTAHFPHTLNYPWIVERLLPLAGGSSVLDIGAGVSPVPLLLSSRGLSVTCIDSHPVVRVFPVAPNWNEWGYFDYGVLDRRINAIHGSVLDHHPVESYDAIYSISVLAHMTRETREATIERCWRWLRPRGRLLLAVDLIPASDFLWNRSGGEEVEPLMRHGTSDDLITQLQALGMDLAEHVVLRCVRTSRTDLLLLHAQKPDAAT